MKISGDWRESIYLQSPKVSHPRMHINHKEKDNNLTVKILTSTLLWSRWTSLRLRHQHVNPPLRGCKALPLGFLARDKDIPKEPRWKAGSLWDLVMAFSNCGRGTWVLSKPPFYILNSVFHKAAIQDLSEVAYQERQGKADKQVNCHRLQKGKEIRDDSQMPKYIQDHKGTIMQRLVKCDQGL